MAASCCFGFVVLLVLWTPTTADIDVSCVVMETCMLPCSFHSGSDIVIHWIQTMKEYAVHSYYHNQDQLDHQNQGFRGRTSLFQDQISRGNASLQLRAVQVQDQGQYKCYCSTSSSNKETFINLTVDGPVRKVHIARVGNTLSCRSEGIYPEPGLTWSTNPASNKTLNTTAVQQNEQLLYNISSSLVLDDGGTDVDYSCRVTTRTNSRRATLFKLTSIEESDSEPTIRCSVPHTSVSDLIWRFNHSQIIVTRTGTDNHTVSEQWRQHVKSVSQSGSLTLTDLTPDQGGVYTCELSNEEETLTRSILLSWSRTETTNHEGKTRVYTYVVIGVLLVVLVVLVVAVTLMWKKKRRKKDDKENKKNSETDSGIHLGDRTHLPNEPATDALIKQSPDAVTVN